MKLAIGIVLFVGGSAWLLAQIRYYARDPGRAVSEDLLDLLFDFAPGGLAALFLTAMGAALVYLHFTEA